MLLTYKVKNTPTVFTELEIYIHIKSFKLSIPEENSLHTAAVFLKNIFQKT